MAQKKSFLVYMDCEQHLQLLSNEERGKLFMALFGYAKRGEIPKFDGMLKMAFSFIKAQMDRDAEKYEAICERNRANGIKGGRPPNESDNPE